MAFVDEIFNLLLKFTNELDRLLQNFDFGERRVGIMIGQ